MNYDLKTKKGKSYYFSKQKKIMNWKWKIIKKIRLEIIEIQKENGKEYFLENANKDAFAKESK